MASVIDTELDLVARPTVPQMPHISCFRFPHGHRHARCPRRQVDSDRARRRDSASASVSSVESRYDRAGGGSASPGARAEEALRSRRGGPCPAPTSTRAACRRGRPRAAEVVEHGGDAAAEDLEPLLRQPAGRRRPSRRACRRASSKRMWAREAVAALDRPPGCGTATAWADDGARARERGEQVDEVAALAEQPAAAVLGIVQPVVVGERAGVDAHREHESSQPARARPAAARRAARSGG